MGRKPTILDAAIEALRAVGGPASARQLLGIIKERSLYEFSAKDPVAVLRAAVRKHVKSEGARSRIRLVEKDQFALNA